MKYSQLKAKDSKANGSDGFCQGGELITKGGGEGGLLRGKG